MIDGHFCCGFECSDAVLCCMFQGANVGTLTVNVSLSAAPTFGQAVAFTVRPVSVSALDDPKYAQVAIRWVLLSFSLRNAGTNIQCFVCAVLPNVMVNRLAARISSRFHVDVDLQRVCLWNVLGRVYLLQLALMATS